MLDVPVVLLVYRRPAETRRVFDLVRAAQPQELLVVADGPRAGDAAESALCDEVRRLIEAGIDWPCELSTNYSATNLGLAERVAGGLDWVFSRVERAIVLEEDILPAPSFFGFCRELLERYEDEPRVMQVSGSNFAGRLDTPYSYGFSKHAIPPWGWASWARAWRLYDRSLSGWSAARSAIEEAVGPSFRFWDALINRYDIPSATWDVQWAAALWANRGLSAVPAVNLVQNIGFGAGATNTGGLSPRLANLPCGIADSPLRHPPEPTDEADRVLEPVLAEAVGERLGFLRQIGSRRRPATGL